MLFLLKVKHKSPHNADYDSEYDYLLVDAPTYEAAEAIVHNPDRLGRRLSDKMTRWIEGISNHTVRCVPTLPKVSTGRDPTLLKVPVADAGEASGQKPKKTKETVKKMDPDSEEWEALANAEARAFAPEIYPCVHCGYPVVSGYICTGCGSDHPTRAR